ncbi:MAG: hypothetical protein MMC33_009215 [Icmadophila ericetorum]|nr:hypothetical protein [Icmadophila ericetorum]
MGDLQIHKHEFNTANSKGDAVRSAIAEQEEEPNVADQSEIVDCDRDHNQLDISGTPHDLTIEAPNSYPYKPIAEAEGREIEVQTKPATVAAESPNGVSNPSSLPSLEATSRVEGSPTIPPSADSPHIKQLLIIIFNFHIWIKLAHLMKVLSKL